MSEQVIVWLRENIEHHTQRFAEIQAELDAGTPWPSRGVLLSRLDYHIEAKGADKRLLDRLTQAVEPTQ